MSSPPPTPNDLTRQQLDELDTLLQRMLSLPLTGPAAAPPGDAPPPPLPDLPPLPPTLGAGWRADASSPGPSPHLNEARVAPPAVQLAAVLPPSVARTALADAHPHAAPVPTWDPDPLARHRVAPSRPAPAEPFTPPTPDTGVPPSTATHPARPDDAAPPVVTGTLRGVDAPAVPLGFRSPFEDAAAAEPPEPATVALATAERLAEPARPPADRVPVPLWPVFALNWVLELVFGLFGPVGEAATRPPVKHLLGIVGLLLLAAAGVWAARGMGWVSFPLPWLR